MNPLFGDTRRSWFYKQSSHHKKKKLQLHGVVNLTKVLSYWFYLLCFSVSFENQVFLNLSTKCLKVETLAQWYKGTLMFCVYIVIRLPWLNLLLWSGAKLRSRGYNRRYRNEVGKKTSFFSFHRDYIYLN